MSIPKKIHYCWFGKNSLPKSVEKCINSWKKFCPDYEIIRWDEDNFDVSDNLYAKQALENKKYAFVSDYARLNILYDNGGIYLDTDVELIKSLDDLLTYSGYMGFEKGKFISENERIFEMASGLGMGAEPKNEIVFAMLSDYDNIPFVDKTGNFDTLPCPRRNTLALKKLGFITNGEMQVIDNFCILPPEYLSPKDFVTRKITITKNTYSIHHYDGSYLTKKDKFDMLIARFYTSKLFEFLKKIKRSIIKK